MKKVFTFRNFIFLISIISLGFFLFSILVEEVNKYLTYISLVIFGISAASVYNLIIKDSSAKRTKWLESRLKLWNSISYKVKLAGEKSFSEMPVGIIVFNEEKMIEWANSYAKKIFLSPLVEREIVNLNKDLYNKILLYNVFDIDLYDHIYSCTVLRDDNILFLVDKTDLKSLERKYEARTLGIGIINLDNLDQALSVLDPQEKTMQISNIMGILADWCNTHQIYLRGYTEEQYLIIMDRTQTEELIKEEFKVISDVHDYCAKENLRITVSIGIACEDKPILDLTQVASESLQLALNRGGNQAVVYVDGKTSFYGGKINSIESRSPIYVRVKTEDLVDLIKDASNVLVMTHADMDSDAFGSSIAMTKLVRSLDKECYTVFDEKSINETVSIVYSEIVREHLNLTDMFIKPKDALAKIEDDTLLIIVDCQYQNLLMNEKVYKKAKNVAIIDHHRRSADFISDPTLTFHEVYASSTCELVTEIIQYSKDDITLTLLEAESLYGGIMVDTKNFTFKTGVRTFEAAAYLRKCGVDIIKVKKWFQSDLETYNKISEIVANAEIVNETIGISVYENENIDNNIICAKAADELLTISDITASFVIGNIGDKICISGRSIGDINVQIILEKLGGGGHITLAGAQIEGMTIEEVKQELIIRINEYFTEISN